MNDFKIIVLIIFICIISIIYNEYYYRKLKKQREKIYKIINKK